MSKLDARIIHLERQFGEPGGTLPGLAIFIGDTDQDGQEVGLIIGRLGHTKTMTVTEYEAMTGQKVGKPNAPPDGHL